MMEKTEALKYLLFYSQKQTRFLSLVDLDGIKGGQQIVIKV